jgi:uncharacterized protein YwlG (UPF0340 family)
MEEDKNEIVDGILAVLGSFSLRDQVEILGNVFLQLGFSTMEEEGSPIDIGEIDASNVVEIITEDVRQRGETLGNALAKQGLTLLIWLNK